MRKTKKKKEGGYDENPATLALLLCRPLFTIKDQSDLSEPCAEQLVSGIM